MLPKSLTLAAVALKLLIILEELSYIISRQCKIHGWKINKCINFDLSIIGL